MVPTVRASPLEGKDQRKTNFKKILCKKDRECRGIHYLPQATHRVGSTNWQGPSLTLLTTTLGNFGRYEKSSLRMLDVNVIKVGQRNKIHLSVGGDALKKWPRNVNFINAGQRIEICLSVRLSVGVGIRGSFRHVSSPSLGQTAFGMNSNE